MDAKVRRLLWNDISNLTKENRIVVLTSHNMDECEALCTRLVIMVNGKFKCLGSPQHLKSKFGTGYKISMKLVNEYGKNKNLVSFMKTYFPVQMASPTINKHLFEFTVPYKDTKLSTLFNLLEENRSLLGFQDYCITQGTLDQVFINFAFKENVDSDTFADKANSDEPLVLHEYINKTFDSESLNTESTNL